MNRLQFGGFHFKLLSFERNVISPTTSFETYSKAARMDSFVNRPVVRVVDDDVAVCNYTCDVLRSAGFSTLGFDRVESALADLDDVQTDCIVADWSMPGLNGFDLQRRLIERKSPISLVVISGKVDVSAAVKFMEQGAVSVIQKPFATQDLVRCVQKAILATRQRRQEFETTRSSIERYRRLDTKEKEVLGCILDGLQNKSIASHLDISPRTVDRRRSSIMEKLKVDSVSALVQVVACVPNEMR